MTRAALDRARVRHLALSRSEREEMWESLVAGTHKVMCAPHLPASGGRFSYGDPGPIWGEHCVCGGVPMLYTGPNGREDLRDMQVVSQTTACRTSRVGNMSDGRLVARLAYLGQLMGRVGEWAETRETFRARVREVVAIEDELDCRSVRFSRVSRRPAVRSGT